MRCTGLLLASALLVLSSCVGYLRFRENEPVPRATLERLRPGTDDLEHCLALLGAPVQVFEYRGDGMALLWSWQDTDDWSIDVSVPLAESVNANFDLDLTFLERPGCVLWFGPDLVLGGWRAGMIGERNGGRARPEMIESRSRTGS